LSSPGFSSGLFIFHEVLVEIYLGATAAATAARLGFPWGPLRLATPYGRAERRVILAAIEIGHGVRSTAARANLPAMASTSAELKFRVPLVADAC
jgi:hypothetical protein